MSYAICVENLGKRYRLIHGRPSGGYQRFSESLTSWAKTPLNWLAKPSKFKPAASTQAEDFWALKDINFTITPGEKVGIIGRNGAGKSTLLKLLSRITEPTTGRITLRGRVASLLEVGTGFHPELTGRENIFMNGAILGMTRSEIRSRLDDIVAFAEVESFLDMPVKRYSSGMQLRLAFAVAAHLDPEILVVDEVLAVGDAAFQKKCLTRLGTLSGRSPTTVLFVSHNMESLMRLCARGILLDKGGLVMDGVIERVVDHYNGNLRAHQSSRHCADDSRPDSLRGQARLVEVGIGGQHAHSDGLPFGEILSFVVTLVASAHLPVAWLCYAIFSSAGEEIASSRMQFIAQRDATLRMLFKIPHLRLRPGHYWINLGVKSDRGDEDFVSQVLFFQINPDAAAANDWTDSIRAHCIPESILEETTALPSGAR